MIAPRARNPVGTLETAIEILEYIKHGEGATLQELSADLPYAKSTVHRHLSTLRQAGYVVKSGDVFDVSFRFFDLASYKRERNPLFLIGRPITDEVSNQVEERVSLIVEEHGRAVKCYIAETNRSVTTDAHLGLAMHMHCTSSGKAILAHMADADVEAVLDAVGLEGHTDNTITDRDELLAELEEIRERGVAFDDQERILGVRGVAAPVIGQDTDELIGAIDITGPATRLEGEKYDAQIPDLVRRAADEIAVNIQYWRSS